MDKELKELADKAYKQGWLSDHDFATAIHKLFITYPIIDTGNGENVNAELLLHLIDACKKHKFSHNRLKH